MLKELQNETMDISSTYSNDDLIIYIQCRKDESWYEIYLYCQYGPYCKKRRSRNILSFFIENNFIHTCAN